MMNKREIGISADCVCDLPRSMEEIYGIGILHFYITTKTGKFRDGEEISSRNIIEYYRNGGGAIITYEPTVDEYVSFFREQLGAFGVLIHVSVSSGTSISYSNAVKARASLGDLGERLYIVDSLSLSSGMSHLLMKAVEMRDGGYGAPEIVRSLEIMREHLCVSFLVKNPEQMYINGRMSNAAKKFCAIFRMHPIFKLRKGNIVFGGACMGNMKRSTVRYIAKELRNRSKINTERLFITHVGCSLGRLNEIKKEVEKRLSFNDVIFSDASATISGNCGEETFGLLYIKKY